jgi:RNA recognition motif-containing protein
MKTKLFVGNLSRNTTEEELNALFTKVGTVASIEVITIPDPGNSKRFAFVDMSSPDDAEKAVGMLNGSDLNGHTLKVNIARPREKRPAGGGWYTNPPPPAKGKGSTRRKSA